MLAGVAARSSHPRQSRGRMTSELCGYCAGWGPMNVSKRRECRHRPTGTSNWPLTRVVVGFVDPESQTLAAGRVATRAVKG